MDHRPRPRVVVIDDHPVIASGLAHEAPGVEVVASVLDVEEFLRASDISFEVVR